MRLLSVTLWTLWEPLNDFMKLKRLSVEKKLRLIAERAGWTKIYIYSDNSGPDLLCGYPPPDFKESPKKNYRHARELPDFLNDYTAIVSVVQREFNTIESMRNYVGYLVSLMKKNEFTVNASPLQRANAFLLATKNC